MLLQDFLSVYVDATNAPWHARAPTGCGLAHGLRRRAVGRNFQLPPKKADGPTTSATTTPGS
ncbi:hypothetical protein HBI53_000520 [Parastagonospora nodorum]|nr:hypothetical protein HBI53_000520 [Parastagonospora nodorum]